MVVLMVAGLGFTHLGCSSSSNDEPAAVPRATLDADMVDRTLTAITDNASFCSMEAATAQNPAVLRAVAGTIEDLADQMVIAREAGDSRSALETQTINSDCPGAVGSITLTTPDAPAPGTLSATIAMDHYCTVLDSGAGTTVTLNGGAQLSGLQDTTTSELISLSASTTGTGITATTSDGDTVTVVLLGASVAMSGDTITASLTHLGIAATVGGESANFTVNNLTVKLTDNGTTMSMVGTVELIFSQPGEAAESVGVSMDLTADANTGDVTDGEIVLAGANGTEVTITVDSGSPNAFIVQADTDGDGVDDYEPGTMDCSALNLNSLLP